MKTTVYAGLIVATAGLFAMPADLVAQQAQPPSPLNPAIRVVLRDSYKNLQDKSAMSLKSLSGIAPNVTPQIDPKKFSASEYAKMASLGLPVDAVVVDMQGRTRQQALDLAKRFRSNPLVRSVEVDDPTLASNVADIEGGGAARSVGQRSPDFGSLTDAYLKGWNETIPNFAIGGINSVAAREYPGADGSNVRMIMTYQSSTWLHNDLPVAAPKFRLPGCNTQTPGNNYMAGIVFGTGKNGAIRGMVPNLKLTGAIATASDIGVVEAMPYLEPGDVVVITEERTYSPANGPAICELPPSFRNGTCSLPAISGRESGFNTLHGVVKYATEQLGVHIIVNAGYGFAPDSPSSTHRSVNLDDAFYEGRYDRNRYDDGAIYVGAADPRTGKIWRRLNTYASDYTQTNVGSRIDVFGWGSDVPSIAYGSGGGYTIGGSTNAATAMVAGAVAQIQSIAFAKGLGAIPPKEMRRLIVETGHPLPNPDPSHPIGVMPDVAAAVKKLLDGGGGGGADTEAPSTPGNFRATATTSNSVTLAWEAATDNVGVTHYQIRNAGGWLVKTVNKDTLTYTVEGLEPGAEYKYTVSALDKALNVSAFSPAVTVNLPLADTQAPSTPGNFRATATTSNSVTLAWEAATDNVGVTHYQIRNAGGWLVKTVDGSTLTYTVEELQPGAEYKYTVTALDKVLNESPRSSMISATTQ